MRLSESRIKLVLIMPSGSKIKTAKAGLKERERKKEKGERWFREYRLYRNARNTR